MTIAASMLVLAACQPQSTVERQRTEPTPVIPISLKGPQSHPTNFIVVSFDAMRPDYLSAYGANPYLSPNIHTFAAQSIVYEEAYSAAPVTPTSFASFFTGMLPTQTFIGWNLDAPYTAATMFSDAGYSTAAFLNNVQLDPKRGFDAGFSHFSWYRSDPDHDVLDEVLSWIGQPRDGPFFVWIHFLDPHAPYVYDSRADFLYTTDKSGRFAISSSGRFEINSQQERERIRDLYRGEIWKSDLLWGEFLSQLVRAGIYDESVIVLTSDHGEEFGEHGGYQHGRLYQEHLRIPLIIRHPALERRVTVRSVVRSIDLLPTLLELAGIPIPKSVAGDSALSFPTGVQRAVIGISMTGEDQRWASLATGSRKLIVGCGSDPPLELYDLEKDAHEMENIASIHPHVARGLLADLSNVLGGDPCEVMTRASNGKSSVADVDEESLEALRSLGYVQ